MSEQSSSNNEAGPIFIISGGAGALGKHVARVALSQFPGHHIPVLVIPQIRTLDQLSEAVNQVVTRKGSAIIHTMVDAEMRVALEQLAMEHGIPTIDTISTPLMRLEMIFERPPVGQPGIYQGEHEMYLERIQAIEYTVDHDDGRNPHELHQADVVLTGVSRVGKTPLSIYLSVLGWKVANVPLVKIIAPPKELFEIDRRRVVGLTIDAGTLVQHRRWRQYAFGGAAGRSYTDLDDLYEEVAAARQIFRRGGFAVIDVTNRPIEESADQVIALISRWFEHPLRRSTVS